MKIRNLETGEITEINPQDAGQYGITPEAITEFKAGQPYTPGGTTTSNGTTYDESQRIPFTNKPLGAFATKVEPTPSPTSGATSTTTSTDISSQLANVEEKRQAEFRARPDKITEIDKYWDSEIERIDPGGAGRAKLKEKDVSASAETMKLQGLGKSGIEAIQEARKIYKEDPSVLTKQLIPGHFLSKKFDAVLYNAADTVLRLRTGAQANPSEIKGYMTRLSPSFGDDADTVEFKFKQLEEILSSASGYPIPPQTDNGKLGAKPSIKEGDIGLGSTPKLGPIISGQGNSGDEAFTNLQQATLLAKQALTEKDPEKKRQLLADSRALSKIGSEQNQKLTINPITYGLGKIQENLTNEETLPAIGGLIGGFAGPGGSAIGAAEGQYLKTMLQRKNKGQEGLMTPGEAGGIALKAGEYYAINKIFSAGGKYVKDAWAAKTLSPTKIAGFLREKAAEATPNINTTKIIQAGERWAKLDPQSAEAWNELKSGISPNMNTKDLLDQLTAWGGRTWNLMGNQKDKAASELMKHVYGAGRDVIFEQAPEVAKHTAELRNIAGLPKMVTAAQKGSWFLLKLLGIGKLL
jgi:hypothetical protein